jgi:formylglycine-generating enzyme required for sulfatase activity
MSLRGRLTTTNRQRSRNLSKQRADYFPRKACRVEGTTNQIQNTMKMKKTMISVCALLLVGAASMMTAGAQTKPTLAVFVVGDNTISSPLTTALGANLTSGGRYALTSASTGSKLTELQATYAAGGGSSIDRDALAVWGRTNNISAICLVVDDKKGNDHLFSAQLIDAKDSKLSGKGNYVRTNVAGGDATRVALALTQQLVGSGRRRSALVSARSYPAELDIEMVFVEGGTFKIGCNGTTDVQPTDGKCYSVDSRETPQRTISVSSFSIGKYEITRAQWLAVMKDHPTLANLGNWKDDDQLPIESVNWFDVDTAFLPRLRVLTGKQYRLPTNAEWEYAARGCKAGVCDNYKYSGSDVVEDVAWYLSNSGSRTHPVGQKKPNGLGIYDMSGNVWVWCSDWYDVNYYKNTLTDGAANPTGPSSEPSSGSSRVIRGAAWGNNAIWPRVAARYYYSPSTRDGYVGIRVVLPAQ